MKKPLALLLLVLCYAFSVRAEDSCSVPVPTASGQVRGQALGDACAWRGIPYAAPPVGRLRWQAPEPAIPWSGVRDAVQFGPTCMQPGRLSEGKMMKIGTSEDCLFLNVWRPRKSGVFPVMVYMHGGGYYIGQAGTPWYWGDRLAAEKDLVVVSLNYRLNVLGFLGHPALREEDPNHSTGGYATLDQAFALRWVRDNIANFGGDPHNVTIFGESAGGWSVCTLYASPAARGLFDRAIIESGGCDTSHELEVAYEQAAWFSEAAGCKQEDIECLRSVPADTLMDLVGKQGGMVSGMRFAPAHDGWVLRKTPLQMIREGDYARVPLIAGFNREEGAAMMKLYPKFRRVRPAAYESSLVEMFQMPAAEAGRLAALYPLSEFHGRPVEAYGQMFGRDLIFVCSTREAAVAALGHGSPAWLYRFDYDNFRGGKYAGAVHGINIPFVFDTLDRSPADRLFKAKHLAAARPLQELMNSYYANFARGGDPNGPGLPAWPRFDPATDDAMILDEHSRAGSINMREKCAFWNDFSARYGAGMESARRNMKKK